VEKAADEVWEPANLQRPRSRSRVRIEPATGARCIADFLVSVSATINLCALSSRPEAAPRPARAHLFSQIQVRGRPVIAAASALQIVIVGGLILRYSGVPSSVDGLTKRRQLAEIWDRATAGCAEPRDRAHGQAPGTAEIELGANGASGASATRKLWLPRAGMSGGGVRVPVGRRQVWHTGECYTPKLLGGSRSGLLSRRPGTRQRAVRTVSGGGRRRARGPCVPPLELR